MRYYYGQLTKPLQGVYDTLLSGFRVYAPSIRIPDVEQGQLAEVYLRLKLDEPLLFYVTGYRCRWMPGAAHLELLPEYLFIVILSRNTADINAAPDRTVVCAAVNST